MSTPLRRIRWRLIWSSILALAVTLGCFYLTQKLYAFSDDECTWMVVDRPATENGRTVNRMRVVVQEVLPEGVAEEAGLLEDDELVQIGPMKVRPETVGNAQRFINFQPEGRMVMYTVYRHGKAGPEKLVMPVRLVKHFSYDMLLALITGLVAWALGLLVVVSSPQRKVARHFYYLGLVCLLSAVSLRGFVGNLPISLFMCLALLGDLVTVAFPALWLHFFLLFPHPFEAGRKRRTLVLLYGIPTLIFLVLAVRTLAINGFGPAPITDLAPALTRPVVNLPLEACFLGTILAGLVLFWVGSFKQSPRRRRAFILPLLLSTIVLVDLAIFRLMSLQARGLMFQRHSWIFFLPVPLLPFTYAYAVFRHGFFDVRRAILRWMTYFAVLGAILGGYLTALAWAFTQGAQLLPPAWVGVLTGLLALPLGWLLRSILLWLRRRFHRDQSAAREQVLSQLREGKKRFSEEALLATLAEAVRKACRPNVLHLVPIMGSQILLPAPDEMEGDLPAIPRTLTLPPQVLRHAREQGELVLGLDPDEAEWVQAESPALRAQVDALGLQVLVLLLAGEEPHSALLLGGKYAELSYGREDREMLREVALAAGMLLESARLHRRMLDQGRLEQELATARKIQESLITAEAPMLPGFQMALRLEPAFETGGDLLWVKRRQTGRWIAAVGDVSGKGLAAALYMSQATALLKFATQREGQELETLLPAMDHTLRNLMGPKDFLTLSLLEWEESGHFRLLRAGHPAPLLVTGTRPGDIQELAIRGRGLGLRPARPGDWEILEGRLEPRQWLVLYSDGITEAMNGQEELYGTERLKALLAHYWVMGSPRAACEALFHEVSRYEVQNRDDRTVFILGRDAHE